MKKKISENLSSKSLFHFTSKREYLISILRHGFRPRYCLEDYSLFTKRGKEKIELGVPMVCFCDIPLSKIKSHLSRYGGYGIGLSKSWGQKSELSPLLYCDKKSRTTKLIKTLFHEISITKYGVHKTIDISNEMVNDLIRYAKPYSGKMFRGNKYENVRFYDEREWRYVPDTSSKKLKPAMSKAVYMHSVKREEYNQDLANNFKLGFSPDDIKYIILNEEAEIDDFIRELENIKGKFDSITRKRLITRIISKESILYDF